MSARMKKLYKSRRSRIVSGVFGGLGEWMEVNPNILRAGYVILAIITSISSAILVYIVAHFFIPADERSRNGRLLLPPAIPTHKKKKQKRVTT